MGHILLKILLTLRIILSTCTGQNLAKECFPNGVCLTIPDTTLSYSEAFDYCQTLVVPAPDYHSILARIKQSATQSIVQDFISNNGITGPLWISATLEENQPQGNDAWLWNWVYDCSSGCDREQKILQNSLNQQGCYQDSDATPDFAITLGSGYDVSSCQQACYQQEGDGVFAGVQDTDCFCGGVFGQYGPIGGCTLNCIDGYCSGGNSKNSVYRLNGTFGVFAYIQPDGGTNEYCGASNIQDTFATPKYPYSDFDCSDQYLYICSFSSLDICRDKPNTGFYLNTTFGTCVYLSDPTLRTTWYHARKACWDMGGDLVTFQSVAEHTEVLDFAASQVNTQPPNNLAYIGLIKISLVWDQIHTDEEMTYYNFAVAEPNLGNGNCMVVDADDNSLWKMSQCTTQQYFLCYEGPDDDPPPPTTEPTTPPISTAEYSTAFDKVTTEAESSTIFTTTRASTTSTGASTTTAATTSASTSLSGATTDDGNRETTPKEELTTAPAIPTTKYIVTSAQTTTTDLFIPSGGPGESTGDGGLTRTEKILIGVLVPVGVILIILLIVFLVWRNKKKEAKNKVEPSEKEKIDARLKATRPESGPLWNVPEEYHDMGSTANLLYAVKKMVLPKWRGKKDKSSEKKPEKDDPSPDLMRRRTSATDAVLVPDLRSSADVSDTRGEALGKYEYRGPSPLVATYDSPEGSHTDLLHSYPSLSKLSDPIQPQNEPSTGAAGLTSSIDTIDVKSATSSIVIMTPPASLAASVDHNTSGGLSDVEQPEQKPGSEGNDSGHVDSPRGSDDPLVTHDTTATDAANDEDAANGNSSDADAQSETRIRMQ